jgi:hypothetical protein
MKKNKKVDKVGRSFAILNNFKMHKDPKEEKKKL